MEDLSCLVKLWRKFCGPNPIYCQRHRKMFYKTTINSRDAHKCLMACQLLLFSRYSHNLNYCFLMSSSEKGMFPCSETIIS